MLDRVSEPSDEIDDLFLTPGVDAIDLFGKLMVCQGRTVSPRGYLFAEHVNGPAHAMTIDDIWRRFHAGSLQFVTTGEFRLPDRVRRNLRQIMSTFGAKERANITRRLRYMLAIEKAGQDLPRSKAAWDPIIRAVDDARDVPEKDRQHWFTHYRWWLLWTKAGCDARVLAGFQDRKGAGRRKLEPYQIKALDEVVPQFLHRARPRYATIMHAVNLHIRTHLGGEQAVVEASEKKLKSKMGKDYQKNALVGYKTVRAECLRLGRATRLHYRHGAEAARQAITPVYAGPHVELPLQRVEADFKYLRLFVLDDAKKVPLGTPFLAAAIDTYSGAVAGFDIGFDPPGRASTARCLANVISRKDVSRLLDPDGEPAIKNDWPINGVPTRFVIDNDQAFHSVHFFAAARELRCDAGFLAPGDPSSKGTIESFWRSMQVSYTDQFPGKVLRLTDRPERGHKPDDDAVITLTQLHTFIAKAIVDVHNQGVDFESGEIRIERYRAAAAVHRPRPLRHHDDLVELVGCYAKRVATRKGIRIFGLFYNSDELAMYRDSFDHDPVVEVRYFTDDIRRIRLIDKAKKISFWIPCKFAEYTAGLTLHQHEVISRRAADRGPAGRIYRRDLELAKVDLFALGQKMMIGAKARRKRQRIARYFGVAPSMMAAFGYRVDDAALSREKLGSGSVDRSQDDKTNTDEEAFGSEADIRGEVAPDDYVDLVSDETRPAASRKGRRKGKSKPPKESTPSPDGTTASKPVAGPAASDNVQSAERPDRNARPRKADARPTSSKRPKLEVRFVDRD